MPSELGQLLPYSQMSSRVAFTRNASIVVVISPENVCVRLCVCKRGGGNLLNRHRVHLRWGLGATQIILN